MALLKTRQSNEIKVLRDGPGLNKMRRRKSAELVKLAKRGQVDTCRRRITRNLFASLHRNSIIASSRLRLKEAVFAGLMVVRSSWVEMRKFG